jgi:hypothetical protein
MARDHDQADSGRLLSAHLSGIALRHARWGGLTEAGKASGAAELPEVAGDRGDLLAEVAGLALGSANSRGPEYEARGQAVAEPCRMAGADEALIVSGQVGSVPGLGRPMVPMPPRSPTAFGSHAGDAQARTPDYW